jgi:hypothetical protein
VRTDQLSVCTRCAKRFALAPTCPRCRRPAVDLRTDPGLAVARARLSRPGLSWVMRIIEAYHLRAWRPSLHAVVGAVLFLLFFVWVAGTLIAGGLVGVGLGVLVGRMSPWGSAFTLLAVPLAVAGLAIGLWVMTRSASLLASVFGGKLRLGLVRAPAPRPAVRVRGRVRAKDTLRAPIGRARCVAYRLVGAAPSLEVDDAAAVPFDVVTPSGEVVAVDSVLAVDVRVPAPRDVMPTDELRAFLDCRAVGQRAGVFRLGEAHIADGDEIEVDGIDDPRAAPAGYRDTTWTRALRDVVIRRTAA